MKIKNNDRCTFCKQNPETLLHLFWNCETSKQFWSQLHLYINTECNLSLPEFKLEDIIFGSMSLDKALSIILLQAKYFLYSNKMKEIKPSIEQFKNRLITFHKVDRYNATISLNITTLEDIWKPYTKIIHKAN